jgi:uncharacterized membrane protein
VVERAAHGKGSKNAFSRIGRHTVRLGLGRIFDGIIFHQVLRWHHMLSSWYPVNSLQNYELNTLWDGIFHSTTYLFVVAGLYILWRTAQRFLCIGQANYSQEQC